VSTNVTAMTGTTLQETNTGCTVVSHVCSCTFLTVTRK